MAARTVAGVDMIQFLRQVAEFVRRKIGRLQARFFIGVDIIGEARMAGAWTKCDMRLAMPDQEDARAQITLIGVIRAGAKAREIPALPPAKTALMAIALHIWKHNGFVNFA
jgi:hypothetical protein